MARLINTIKELAKGLVFKHTSLAAPTYRYNIEPIQLAYLVTEIERLKNIPGNVVEIGVARGLTTRFLAQHIKNQKLDMSGLKLYAVDTFDSFTDQDLDFEVKNRGKSLEDLVAFGYNDFEVWKRNFVEFDFVIPVKADCSTVDYNKLGPITVAFLDVDLYLPTKQTLPKLFDALVPGGVILIDDVKNNNVYDGAYQAYTEFCAERSLTPEVIGNKCGVLRKHA
jgi:predicted O-methyltransferase YrrM